ncbi:hypothetical protein C8Q78DRAFT_994406 [Trametes maxima]|nr:hypothetical protein C8Q78DRAFT_994406 [Trametes maxima]
MAGYCLLGLAVLAVGPTALAGGIPGLGISPSVPLLLPSTGTLQGFPGPLECATRCIIPAAKNVGCPDLTASACYCQNPTFFKKVETCFSEKCSPVESQGALALLTQTCGPVPSFSSSDITPIGTATGGATVSSVLITIVSAKSASTPAVSLPTTITTSQPLLSSATSVVPPSTTTSADEPRHVSPPGSSGTVQSISDSDVTTTITSDVNAQTGDVLNPSTNDAGPCAEGLHGVVIAFAGVVMGALLL